VTTKTAVLNKALRALGEAAMVGPDDTRVGVRRCVEAYDDVVTGLLSSHPWNFAMSVVALSGSTAPKPGWTYAFPKPGDCLRIVRVSVTDQPDDVGLRYADSAGEILTNQMNPYLRFISSSWRTNEGAWPELFADAVGEELSASNLLAGGAVEKFVGRMEAVVIGIRTDFAWAVLNQCRRE
jgi:hypothetical protein